MSRPATSDNLEWWLNPHPPTDEHDAAHEYDVIEQALFAGLKAEAGRLLTDREIGDALDYFRGLKGQNSSVSYSLRTSEVQEYRRCDPIPR